MLGCHSSWEHAEHMLIFFIVSNVIDCSSKPCLIHLKELVVTHDWLVFTTCKSHHTAMSPCMSHHYTHNFSSIRFNTELVYTTIVISISQFWKLTNDKPVSNGELWWFLPFISFIHWIVASCTTWVTILIPVCSWRQQHIHVVLNLVVVAYIFGHVLLLVDFYIIVDTKYFVMGTDSYDFVMCLFQVLLLVSSFSDLPWL